MELPHVKAVGCPHCLDFYLERRLTQPYIPGHYSGERIEFPSVVAAAEWGCKGCRVLRFAVKPYIQRTGLQPVQLNLFTRADGIFTCQIIGLGKKEDLELFEVPKDELGS
jgi:hypothetical protein